LDKLPFYRGRVQARAKLNLTLQVFGRRTDGMHELRSVMTTLALADLITVEFSFVENPDGKSSPRSDTCPGSRLWRVESNVKSVPGGEGNLCYRAAEMFFEYAGVDPGSVQLAVWIDKHIPEAAVLGGGSADAAAILRFLYAGLQEGILDRPGEVLPRMTCLQLEQIALRCGADVPFCLYGGVRLCGGVGEIMTPLPKLSPVSVLLAVPPHAVQTKEAFRMLDQRRSSGFGSETGAERPMRQEPWRKAISRQSLKAIAPLVQNDFTSVISESHGQTASLLEALRATSASVVSMSGSGPSCFALFADRKDCEESLAAIRPAFSGVRFFITEIDSTADTI